MTIPVCELTEKWEKVVGFDGYEVSDFGRVRRTIVNVLAPSLDFKKRPRIALYSNGKKHSKFVHALVAEAFIGPRPEGMEVNHKDGVKQNNKIDNLEYLTGKDNIRHAIETGLYAKRRKSYAARKLTDEQVVEIRSLIGSMSLRAIAERYGVTNPTIYAIKSGKTWQHS